MTDADDSIVLSDLVRTGEASRLRRRGAMRLDHAVSSSAAGASQGQRQDQRQRALGSWDPPSVIRVRSPTWAAAVESGSEGDEDTGWEQRDTDYETSMQAEPVTDSRRADAEKEKEIYDHMLFCGGEEDEDWDNQPLPPAWEPSPFPLFPPAPSAPSSSRSRHSMRKSKKRNNGCGAIIHMHASPRRRQGVWMAKSEAMDSVVAMDSSYFDRKAVVKMLRSACGCVREGVGCAVCGNTLGTRYKPCQAAAEGLFSTRTRPSRPLRPEGPQYWHAHSPTNSHSHSIRHPHLNSSLSHAASTSSSHSSAYYVYTFFSANVTSSPSFTFPPHLLRHHHPHPPTPRSQLQLQSQYPPTDAPMGMRSNPVYDPTFFDRVMTQSPTPIWEEGAESSEMGMGIEPDQQPEPISTAEQVGGGQYVGSGVYLVGPASGAGIGVGTGIGFGTRFGMSRISEGDEILDPDGVVIGSLDDDGDGEGGMLTEPNSPDKLGEGISLPLPASLPER